MFTFQLPTHQDTLDRKTHSPEREQGRGDPVRLGHRSKESGSSPGPSRPDLSLPGHLSSITLWKPWSVVFLHCMVSVMKKKKVLIHVNLCENYCVQQYFLVYLFFLCELSLFSFFIYKCLLFLKKDKPMCCRPICNLFLSLIL